MRIFILVSSSNWKAYGTLNSVNYRSNMQQENNNINIRANIVYFLEDLVELARREKHYPYLCMIERDFPKIIDYAIPLDGMGIVNVNCVRYVCSRIFQITV